MLYWIGANLIVIVHFAFVCFVVAGALLALKWRWIIFLHLPAAVWGALIEYQGWICPLTPLELKLRKAGGLEGYQGGFIEHYVLPVLYPAHLTRDDQIILGSFVVIINIAIYSWVLSRGKKKKRDLL